MSTEKLLERLVSESLKRRRKILSTKRNNLALWIGRLVMSFNDLEAELAKAVAMQLGQNSPEIADMINASMSYGQKADLFAALLLRQFAGKRDQTELVRSVLRALNRAEQYRNSICHSHWSEPDVWSSHFSSEILKRKPKTKGGNGLTVSQEIPKANELRTCVNDFWALQRIAILAATDENVAKQYDLSPLKALTARLEKALNKNQNVPIETRLSTLTLFSGARPTT
ncbi:MAG: hypothetical protein ACOZE5_06305 [Verrucomicrobiota bacterium]